MLGLLREKALHEVISLDADVVLSSFQSSKCSMQQSCPPITIALLTESSHPVSWNVGPEAKVYNIEEINRAKSCSCARLTSLGLMANF